MAKPRFGINSLLIVFTVVGLWLSTLSAYTGSNDVQAFIWTAIILTSGVAALSHTARRRAFWIGFFWNDGTDRHREGFQSIWSKSSMDPKVVADFSRTIAG
jgi:hypothetical protein